MGGDSTECGVSFSGVILHHTVDSYSRKCFPFKPSGAWSFSAAASPECVFAACLIFGQRLQTQA